MILYQGTVREFIEMVETNKIISELEDVFIEKLGRKLPPREHKATPFDLTEEETTDMFSLLKEVRES